jgi:hypothetical protein
MDHNQPQHSPHQLSGDQDPNLTAPPYAYYPPDQDPSYALTYSAPITPYQVVQHHPGPPRQLSDPDMQQQGHMQQQGLQFHNLSLMSPHQYQQPVYSSPPQPMPLSASPPPQSPNMYDPLSPPISGSDSSGSSTHSPSSSRGNSLVHRNPIRYNPVPSPTSSSGRRRGRSIDSDEEEAMGHSIVENLAHSRKEATRRQRIEAEQRRRDELRDGYAKLKEVLPISNQKSSKVSLLERATNHMIAMDRQNQELQSRIEQLEAEVARLQKLNEKISLGAANTPSPGHPGILSIDSRPLSPPPESGMQPHSLTSVRGHREDSSPSASEGGY